MKLPTNMSTKFTIFKISLLVGLCLSACAVPDRARSRLGQATIPAEYRSADGHFVVRLRGGTPPAYQVVRTQDGRVLGRAQSAIQERELHTQPPAPTTINVVFAPDDAVICIEEELSGRAGPASRYILFRSNVLAQGSGVGYTASYLRPEANQWSPQPVHYGEAYEWPQVLSLDLATIRFYYPRSQQARNVSLDSVSATDKPTTLE